MAHPRQRAAAPVPRTHCPQGHEYTEANTRVRLLRGRLHRDCIACDRAWRAANNPERYLAWAAANPEQVRALGRLQAVIRRARQADLPSTVTTAQLAETLEYYHHRCAYCLRVLTTFHWDHVIPVARGGGSTQDNLVPACPPCNLSKGTHLLWDVLRAA
ncbi:MAG: HNH endonuclease [Chloroflexota bacterium]|nr:HNH endonuclease [Chloroflexota bacterium]